MSSDAERAGREERFVDSGTMRTAVFLRVARNRDRSGCSMPREYGNEGIRCRTYQADAERSAEMVHSVKIVWEKTLSPHAVLRLWRVQQSETIMTIYSSMNRFATGKSE